MQEQKTNILSPGTTLQSGKYQIEEVLGQGGFGITYKATQAMLGVTFAIKEFFVNTQNYYSHRDTTESNFVKPQFDKTFYAKLREGFINEARTLFQLYKIPHIVQIRDMFEENDTVYIVMDYVEGQSLEQIVGISGALSEEKTKDYARQLLQALDKVHTKNVLHRDIKPANILIKPNGEVVLIDFGIARSFVQDKTQMHTVMLSKGFSPPEQEVEKTKKGSFSDLYSLGATLYYCLTAQTPQTVSDLTFEDYVSARDLNPQVSEDFNNSINKSIEKKPSNRFNNSGEFLHSLSNVKTKKKEIKPKKKNITTPKKRTNKKPTENTIIETPEKPTNFTENIKKIDFEMIAVEGGSFMMGNNEYEDELPIHKVELDDFYIGKYPVTQELWKVVMGNNPSFFQKGNILREGGIFRSAIIINRYTSKHPVEQVSWDETLIFIKKLNKKTGKKYRLPTEAEWEYASKGGNKSKNFEYAGSDNIDDVAWYYENSYDLGEKHPNYGTNPVGQKQANELGVYDMIGNVLEWCNDWYDDDYYKSSTNRNPNGSSSGEFRVGRGGSWSGGVRGLNPANRDYGHPSDSRGDVGFRLVIASR